MGTDPVERSVSEGIHETLSITMPKFVQAIRETISLGGKRRVMISIIQTSSLSPETKLLMETEVDYLIQESKNGNR